jgi:hypothetical protein
MDRMAVNTGFRFFIIEFPFIAYGFSGPRRFAGSFLAVHSFPSENFGRRGKEFKVASFSTTDYADATDRISKQKETRAAKTLNKEIPRTQRFCSAQTEVLRCLQLKRSPWRRALARRGGCGRVLPIRVIRAIRG